MLADLPFGDARAMARSMGMSSREEWEEYSCPGAYRLPIDPDEVWASDWKGWDDFLGITFPFDDARSMVHTLQLTTEEEYKQYLAAHDELERADPEAWNGAHAVQLRDALSKSAVDAGRLPARPAAKYPREWVSWEDWLGLA